MMAPFNTRKAACLALLNAAPLKAKHGSFLGQIAFQEEPLTERQAKYLLDLLRKHDLPTLAEGVLS
jgi:hypothetical protein